MTSEKWLIKPLDNEHNRAKFSCGEPSLDRYLSYYAKQYLRRKVAAIFVYVNTDNNIISGYYTLSATNIPSDELPQEITKKLPRYPFQPATLLGRLAVNKGYQKQGIGEKLLLDALARSWQQSQQIGSIAVVVDVLNDSAAAFYQQYGFINFPDKKNKMFLPMKTIGKLFGHS